MAAAFQKDDPMQIGGEKDGGEPEPPHQAINTEESLHGEVEFICDFRRAWGCCHNEWENLIRIGCSWLYGAIVVLSAYFMFMYGNRASYSRSGPPGIRAFLAGLPILIPIQIFYIIRSLYLVRFFTRDIKKLAFQGRHFVLQCMLFVVRILFVVGVTFLLIAGSEAQVRKPELMARPIFIDEVPILEKTPIITAPKRAMDGIIDEEEKKLNKQKSIPGGAKQLKIADSVTEFWATNSDGKLVLGDGAHLVGKLAMSSLPHVVCDGVRHGFSLGHGSKNTSIGRDEKNGESWGEKDAARGSDGHEFRTHLRSKVRKHPPHSFLELHAGVLNDPTPSVPTVNVNTGGLKKGCRVEHVVAAPIYAAAKDSVRGALPIAWAVQQGSTSQKIHAQRCGLRLCGVSEGLRSRVPHAEEMIAKATRDFHMGIEALGGTRILMSSPPSRGASSDFLEKDEIRILNAASKANDKKGKGQGDKSGGGQGEKQNHSDEYQGLLINWAFRWFHAFKWVCIALFFVCDVDAYTELIYDGTFVCTRSRYFKQYCGKSKFRPWVRKTGTSGGDEEKEDGSRLGEEKATTSAAPSPDGEYDMTNKWKLDLWRPRLTFVKELQILYRGEKPPVLKPVHIRKFGLPLHEEWVALDKFRAARASVGDGSIMVGRTRSLEELRAQIMHLEHSPVRVLRDLSPRLTRWSAYLLFAMVPISLVVNMVTIFFMWSSLPEYHRGRFVRAHVLVSWFEMLSISVFCGQFLILAISYTGACCTNCRNGGVLDRPRLLVLLMYSLKAASRFSALQGLFFIYPATFVKMFRKIRSLDLPWYVRFFGCAVLIVMGPGGIFVLFGKMCQIAKIFYDSDHLGTAEFNPDFGLQNWVWINYVTYLGFANQIVGLTEPSFIELYTMFDFLFGGSDAQFQIEESETQWFVLMTVISDLVGTWGFHGLVYAFNMTSAQWQHLMVTEMAVGQDHGVVVGGSAVAKLIHAGDQKGEMSPLNPQVEGELKNVDSASDGAFSAATPEGPPPRSVGI